MTTDAAIENQKKRAFDAIERRFALAEAELRLQQQKTQKRSYEEKAKVICPTNPSSIHSANLSLTPSPNLSSKKGKFSFSGHSSRQDVEATEPAYFKLSHPVHNSLLMSSTKINNGRGTSVDQILHELLQKGDSAEKYMQGSRSIKIDNWMLLDNVVQKSSMGASARVMAIKNQSKRSKQHMSLKQHKKFGSFSLSEEHHNYESFKPMHEMWKGYVMQLLKTVGKNQLVQCLLYADLHGAFILVAHCKIAAFVGVRGIMIRETAETFGIITEENKFRVVPKKVSVFMFQADQWKITLYGDKLTSRNIGPG